MKTTCMAALAAILAVAPLQAGAANWTKAQASDEPEDTTEVAFTPVYKYRVTLTDKKHNEFSTRHPEQFLSQKSIERRRRQGLKINQTDLPLTRQYVDGIKALGLKVCNMSKWNNTLVVQTEDTTLMDQVSALSYVKGVRRVATYTKPRSPRNLKRAELVPQGLTAEASAQAATGDLAKRDSLRHANLAAYVTMSLGAQPTTQAGQDSISSFVDIYLKLMNKETGDDNEEAAQDEDSIATPYGKGQTQIALNHGESLHERGFSGKGMTIAVIDGGFFNTDVIPLLQSVNLLGTRDFVEPDSNGNVYGSEVHGTMVLSCMAANTPGVFIGTAPDAAYWLLRSEDSDTEQPVEEDNWAAAIEYADSVGVDLVNTSLGYSDFDNKADNYTYWQLDGHHEICSNSASLLASKGIVLCCSAGNEGDNQWKLISVPADADDVLTVGALTSKGLNTDFSSLGHAADGRVKPDVMAMGQDCTVAGSDGLLTQADGTSFASPIMCGMVACYWQAHPQLTALQVIEAVRKLGDRYNHPDNVFGYGTPDFSK